MSKTNESVQKYDDFFGEISVEEVDPMASLQSYSVHASLDYAMLDHAKALEQSAEAQAN